MLPEQQTSSISKQSSTFMETVQDKLKDIKNFSNWSAKEQMIAVGAVGVMVGALLPFVAVALPVAATGAIVALTLFFAVKAVEYTFKGLKWSAEKTVEGAKYTAGKVKDASVYTAEKAREGYYSVKGAISSVGRAAREGTGAKLGKMGRSLSNLSESMSSLDAIPYSIGNEGQTVVLKTEEETRNFNSVKEMLIKEVLGDKAVNSSALTKEIFSKLGEKILEKAYSVDGQSGFQKDQLINRLKQQVDFVNKLDAKKLQNLLSKDNNSLYEIFSEHHDKIKRIVGECKREYEFDQSVRRNNAKDAEERKASKSFSFSSVFSLGRKDSTQSTSSLSKSSSLDSVRTESTAKTATVNPNRLRRSNSSSSLSDGSPQLTPSAPPKVPESPTRSGSPDSGISSGPSTPTKEQSPSINLDPFGSIDSRGLSDPLIPKELNPSVEDLSKVRAELKKTSYLDKWVGQPSTKVNEVKPESTQVKTVG
ncbi:actin-bundling T4SS effector WalE1 family protein [Wolbachia endosymbiont of Dactylopius coccus]|nr:MAG: hypothetical protein TV42_03290 [Wolbachia endosymbiont of Dactylopius coccus]